jgi:hypothetical protein
MRTKVKFFRFCAGIAAYLLGSTALLKWVALPRLPDGIGDTLVAANVAILLIVWLVAFYEWGPVRGNWRRNGD